MQPASSWLQIPFELPGGGKGDGSPNVVARKALGQVPTAHTCDNVLELPNYWALLMEVDGRDEKTPTTAIPAEDVSSVALLQICVRQTLGEVWDAVPTGWDCLSSDQVELLHSGAEVTRSRSYSWIDS